jgi:hypothetical protein
MDAPRAARLVETVLRCYPARWRRRHGEEAAELAALLMRDGTPRARLPGATWRAQRGSGLRHAPDGT